MTAAAAVVAIPRRGGRAVGVGPGDVRAGAILAGYDDAIDRRRFTAVTYVAGCRASVANQAPVRGLPDGRRRVHTAGHDHSPSRGEREAHWSAASAAGLRLKR